MTRRTRSRRGFSLVELLVVMTALSLALLVGASILAGAWAADEAGATTFKRVVARGELADRFRADVAAAEEAPDRLGDVAAGDEALVLRTPGGHVVYRWRDGRLERVAKAGDAESRRDFWAGREGVRVTFVRPPAGSRLVTMRLDEPGGVGRRVDVSAALGGDVR